MVFENGVKNIQAAAYNSVRTVYEATVYKTGVLGIGLHMCVTHSVYMRLTSHVSYSKCISRSAI